MPDQVYSTLLIISNVSSADQSRLLSGPSAEQLDIALLVNNQEKWSLRTRDDDDSEERTYTLADDMQLVKTLNKMLKDDKHANKMFGVWQLEGVPIGIRNYGSQYKHLYSQYHAYLSKFQYSPASSSPRSCAGCTPSSSPLPHPVASYVSPASDDGSVASEIALEPSQSPAAKTPPAKRKAKSRRGRNRPIHEIARLKQQIPALESEVRVLWARADELQRQRLRARAENAQLRNRLQWSVDHARLLESKLQLYVSQRQAVEASMLPALGAVGRNLPLDAEKDTQILQMLSRSVDENYTKTGQVYRAAELVERKTELDDANVLETEDSSVLQIRAVRLQPFDQQTVLKAMWQALEEQTVVKDEDCMEIPLDMKMDVGDITSVKNCIFMTSSTLSGDESEAGVNGTGLAAQNSVARLYRQIMQDRQRVVENALLDQTRAASNNSFTKTKAPVNEHFK
ncbi:unnamed protein product [Phytophthora lilii]|uniref:Unnamed protein product n=1 Tax=Phytophthora lilii TaxID=2077276 RepID=A0A9W7CQ78_9STRA|nr:unnamed protein product [Phytophthora lilii]